MTRRFFEESDGRAALEFLTDYEVNQAKYGNVYPPIIVFLDINMPRMNGLEFLDEFSNLREERYECKMQSTSNRPTSLIL
ncbi:MAG: hypothetical protein AAF394_04530 [Planctomycetota bacterium]